MVIVTPVFPRPNVTPVEFRARVVGTFVLEDLVANAAVGLVHELSAVSGRSTTKQQVDRLLAITNTRNPRPFVERCTYKLCCTLVEGTHAPGVSTMISSTAVGLAVAVPPVNPTVGEMTNSKEVCTLVAPAEEDRQEMTIWKLAWISGIPNLNQD